MTITPKTKRQYILIAVAVLLFFAVLYRYSPLSPGEGKSGDGIENVRAKISKYQQMTEEKEMLLKKTADLDKQLAKAENGLLNGATPALAAVDLQNKLNDIAGRSGITISSQRVLPPPKNKQDDEKPPYIEIPVQISMTASIRQLKEMLYNIASSNLLLHINEADIKASGKENDLQTSVTISGLMANGEV